MPARRFKLSVLCALLLGLPAGAAMARVQLDGVAGAERDNVLALLDLAREPCEAPAWRIRRLFEKAPVQVRDALEAFGYYDAEVSAALELEGDCWVARFEVTPGPAVRLREVSIEITGEGRDDRAYRQLLDQSPLQRGQPLLQGAYEEYKRRFVTLANRRGYFEGRFAASRIDVYPAEGAADVTLNYATGPRYHFGPVSFDQDVVRPDLAERFVDFGPGDYYDARRIGDLYEALQLTGFFDTVTVSTTPRAAPDLDVPVVVRLTPARPRTYTAGVGYGTDTGLKLRAGYINRLRNRSGHQLEINASGSQVIQELGASYRIPLADPRAEWLSFDGGFKHEDTDTSTSALTKLGVKRLQKRGGGWLETQFLDLAYEDYTVGSDEGTSFLPVPGISWTHTAVDRPARPLRGHRVNLQLSGTLEAIGADTAFLQVDLFGKFIQPLWDGARLLARAELGITAKDSIRDLPASVRYFAGGDFSVRGYEYKTLGPVDETGQVTGGSHLLTASLELGQRVFGNWAVAAFVDAGNAFEDFGAMDLKTSVGGGLRWFSPLGPIRFDVAVPLASDAPDDFRIHITLGPDL